MERKILSPFPTDLMAIACYTEQERGRSWLARYYHRQPVFACVLGFTKTGLIPQISAAGATPEARRYTAIADAEFLSKGIVPDYDRPLPSLTAGVSPVFISRAVLEGLKIPISLFNAGLPIAPTVPYIDLGGVAAHCVTTGQALSMAIVQHLFEQGLVWGEKLAEQGNWVILSECVVGGTTTALALLTALGIAARDRVNSSHPQCNHGQKWQVVTQGLQAAGIEPLIQTLTPYAAVAAVGDPMQIVVAGMAIAASQQSGVMLAGGTQMLAVYALVQRIVETQRIPANLDNMVVGTTRWVADDPTGDTVGLAELIGQVPLLATPLSFQPSRYRVLQVYEQGFVKEGVGAGGCAIAASLVADWGQTQLLMAIEDLLARWERRGNDRS
jgi:uncharacterized protein (TIGR00303 family)